MSNTIKDILAQRGTGRSLIDDLTIQINKLKKARFVLADQYGLPIDIGLGAYYIPEKFCDAQAEYEDLSKKDQKLFREFEAEFEDYFYMTEYGGGVWQPSRNC